MIRTLLLTTLILLSSAGFIRGQTKPEAKQPAEPRDELRYDGKPFPYWETFSRTELKAEKRIDALRALAAFGARGYPKESAAAIVELLKDYDNDEAAFKIDASTPEKGTPDQRIIYESLWALGKIGPDASVALLAHLDHKAVRLLAAELIGPSFKPIAITESSVPHLVRWTQSKDGEIRDVAIGILAAAIANEPKGKKGRAYKEVFLQTVTKEKSEKAMVESLAQGVEGGGSVEVCALLLGVLGPRAKSAVPALVRAELWGSAASADALAEIKPTPAERLPGLVMGFQANRAFVRVAAATQLGEMGVDARGAVADLVAEIKKPMREADDLEPESVHVYERMAMMKALVQIAGAKGSLPTVIELLEKNQLPRIERELVQVYLKLETDPKRVLPMLSKSLQRHLGDTEMRVISRQEEIISGKLVYHTVQKATFVDELIMALGAQGENAASAVPLLLKAYDGADEPARMHIVTALAKIGPPANEALPLLRKLLQSQNADLRQAAAKGIEAITKK